MTTLDLSKIELTAGSHTSRERGVCAMEAAAWLAGKPHSDSPPCVAPSIRRLVIGLNDSATPSARQRLKEILPDILGTSTRGDDRQRAYAIADWGVRAVAPLALDAGGKTSEAARLRGLPEIVDAETAKACRDAARKVRDSVRTAAYAAYAAACAARQEARAEMWDRIMGIAIPLIRRISAKEGVTP